MAAKFFWLAIEKVFLILSFGSFGMAVWDLQEFDSVTIFFLILFAVFAICFFILYYTNRSSDDTYLFELVQKYEPKATESEYEAALEPAQQKLDRIIEMEGDDNGERLEDYYLAQLIAEQIRQQRFADFTCCLPVKNNILSLEDYKKERHAKTRTNQTVN